MPAAAFEDAVRQIPARRWLGLIATPYRRDKLDDLIGWQVGQIRHIVRLPREHAGDVGREELALPGITGPGAVARLSTVLQVHLTSYCYDGDADPQAPGGMAAIYRDLAADDERIRQITGDVADAAARGRHCLVLTQWVAHLNNLAGALQAMGYDPVLLRGGMGAKTRAAALSRLQPLQAARRCWSWPPGPTLARARRRGSA